MEQLGYGIGNMADLVSGARVPGVSLSNDLRKLGQIVQRLCRVRFRHVPYFRGYVTQRRRQQRRPWMRKWLRRLSTHSRGWQGYIVYLCVENLEFPRT